VVFGHPEEVELAIFLSVAITVAFSLQIGVVQAATIGFQNVGANEANEATVGVPTESMLVAGKITSSFDNLSGTEVVRKERERENNIPPERSGKK
jgi:hypothetical protein